MVAIEERVHPTPFRTRKLSSPSPMILHNVMWESRPLPKIVRRPPCSSQREGVFFCTLFPVGRRGALRKLSRPACDFDRPRYQPGIFLFWWKSLRGGKPFWKKVLPPRAPPFQKLLSMGLRKDGKSGLACGPHAKINGSVGRLGEANV